MNMEVRCNFNRNVVCVYNRGPRVTFYLGIDATQLTCLQMQNEEFDREYKEILQYTATEFAVRYTKDEDARKMIPLSGSAVRVLTGILRGQPESSAVFSSLNQLEQSMTDTATFRKPDGPVAKVHAYLDKRLDTIKEGKVSRKELIDALVEKGLSAGTVTTQCGVWAKNNGVTFPRPTQAAENKSAARKAAAKKTAKAPAAKKTKAKAEPAAAAA